MKLKVTTSHFKDKREAIREISDAGWWPISWRDAPGEVYGAHKHDADQTLYLIEGFMELGVGSDIYRLNPGDKSQLLLSRCIRPKCRAAPPTSSACPR